ncbi:3-dehydroquinate synthase family protein [Treponema sp.]|uniref:3-dehydroquinate synthase n=1 Tax=Treponema sp. TaxID=166 RepID=UPI00388DA094
MKKTNDSFTLEFAKDSGFDRTEIYFYSGTPDLMGVYFSEDTKQNRLFVTDNTIAALECNRDFVRHFNVDLGDISDIKINESKVYRNGGDTLCIIGSGEKYKTIESVLEMVKAALDSNFNRNCLFIAIGGGVITDMTAFAASMFKRGVDVEFVSTTMLADVDAAVGGKTGCDFGNYKNMIGAFYPAKKLHVFSDFVKSLSQKEYISGLAEAIKTAFLFDKEMLELFKNERDKVLARDSEILNRLISGCTKAKAKIVHEDLREKGSRAFLNLGHTFGHALEAVSGLGEITHGEGVAWGMARAFEYGRKNGLCSDEYAQNGINILASYGYNVGKANVPAEKILDAMRKDKKNMSSVIKLIVQDGPQSTKIIEATDEKILEVLR